MAEADATASDLSEHRWRNPLAGWMVVGLHERMTKQTLARAHGAFNLANGLWPLLHMRSFEAVFGPKTDRWLVRTVAGLLCVNGVTQLRASRSRKTMPDAKVTGMGTAATLAAIDLAYAPTGRIRRIYLLDAATELVWLLLWSRQRR